MPKTSQSPVTVLESLIEKYHLNPFSLSKAINLNYSTVHQILKGKAKITVPTALRFAKIFGQQPEFWLDLQREVDLEEAARDKKLSSLLKSIQKAKVPSAKDIAAGKKAKPGKKNALSAKRKRAAKVPGAKPASKKR